MIGVNKANQTRIVPVVVVTVEAEDAKRLRAIFKFALKAAGDAGADEGNSVAVFARAFRAALDDKDVDVNGYKEEARALRVE
jgi:hypothetical protein